VWWCHVERLHVMEPSFTSSNVLRLRSARVGLTIDRLSPLNAGKSSVRRPDFLGSDSGQPLSATGVSVAIRPRNALVSSSSAARRPTKRARSGRTESEDVPQRLGTSTCSSGGESMRLSCCLGLLLLSWSPLTAPSPLHQLWMFKATPLCDPWSADSGCILRCRRRGGVFSSSAVNGRAIVFLVVAPASLSPSRSLSSRKASGDGGRC